MYQRRNCVSEAPNGLAVTETQPMNNPMLEFLEARRSVKPDRLLAPGPSPDELNRILTIAARVPDHKKLVPWRFVVFEGEARAQMGEVFAEAALTEEREPPSPIRLDTERKRFLRAPLVVGVVSRVNPKPGAPEWEQILSAGAAAFNLCLAANALGFATSWITEWVAYSPRVRAALRLAEHERIAGFVHIGTPAERPADRERPALSDIVTRWTAKPSAFRGRRLASFRQSGNWFSEEKHAQTKTYRASALPSEVKTPSVVFWVRGLPRVPPRASHGSQCTRYARHEFEHEGVGAASAPCASPVIARPRFWASRYPTRSGMAFGKTS